MPKTVRLVGENPALVASEVANDSDYIIAVPTAQTYKLMSVWVELTTTATVGNREMAVEIQDAAADVLAQIRAGALQAASLTRQYLFGQGLPDLTAFRSTDFLMTPLPPIILPAGYQIRVYDRAAIDAAADDMVVQILLGTV